MRKPEANCAADGRLPLWNCNSVHWSRHSLACRNAFLISERLPLSFRPPPLCTVFAQAFVAGGSGGGAPGIFIYAFISDWTGWLAERSTLNAPEAARIASCSILTTLFERFSTVLSGGATAVIPVFSKLWSKSNNGGLKAYTLSAIAASVRAGAGAVAQVEALKVAIKAAQESGRNSSEEARAAAMTIISAIAESAAAAAAAFWAAGAPGIESAATVVIKLLDDDGALQTLENCPVWIVMLL